MAYDPSLLSIRGQVLDICRQLKPDLFKHTPENYNKNGTLCSWRAISREQARFEKIVQAVLIAQTKAGFRLQWVGNSGTANKPLQIINHRST